MKKQFTKLLAIIWLVVFCNNTFAQQTLCYPLEANAQEQTNNNLPLNLLANPQGQTGIYTSLAANNNLCSSGESMPLFYFYKNAGLQFDNSESFIDCAYTIEMTFKFENFPTLFDQPWLKVLGFSNDDTGLFLYKTPFFGDIVFEFWNGNTLLEQCPTGFFNETDWYKLTLTRDCSGVVSVFVNCQFMCSYNDATTQLFLPQPSTGNQIIFFQDDPAILAAEASSGWVKNIKISDFAQPQSEILAACDCLCDELAGCEVMMNALSFTCDPDAVMMFSDTLKNDCSCACDTILMTEVVLQSSDSTFLEEFTCDTDQAGTFFQNLLNVNGCDSIVIFNVSLLESPSLQDSIITNDSGNGDGNISLNIAGGMPPYAYLWSTGDSTFAISNLSAGNYDVTVTDQNGCEVVLSFEVDLINALSEIPTADFRVFPNPNISGTSFQLIIPNTKTQTFQIEIFDALGHLVFQEDWMTSSSTSIFSLEKSLETGVYFFQIKNEVGERWVKKVVVVQ